MARRLRFVPPNYWLHLTQRSNNRQAVFSTAAVRQHFLDLLGTLSEEPEVRIAGYVLSRNQTTFEAEV